MQRLLIKILVFLRYRIGNTKAQRYIEKKIAKLDGGYYYSSEIRKLYKELHGLEIGYGTYGGCWWSNIKIGRYCSFAGLVSLFPSNHPMNLFTTHPITYDTWCAGASKERKFTEEPSLRVGHGVWFGSNSVVLSGCKTIGNGAVIGAGAVVTKDVPPYAIVVGNPAKILRYRLTPEQIEKVERSKWWELDKDELNERMEEFLELTNEGMNE